MTRKTQKKEARFYLAEDARLDQDNKAIIIGLYPADKIIITLPEGMAEIPKEKGVILPGMAILINISGFKGINVIKTSIFTPSGFPIAEDKLFGELDMDNMPDNHANLVAKFIPFKIMELGEYRFVLKIAKSTFEYKFIIETE